MWKYILFAALGALALWLLWPILFPPAATDSAIEQVPSQYGNAYGYTDASGTQITAVGSNTIQITPPSGSGILDSPPIATPIQFSGLAGNSKADA